jgi:hypothetical protein
MPHRYIHLYLQQIKARRCLVLLSEEVVSLEARAEEDFRHFLPAEKILFIYSNWTVAPSPAFACGKGTPSQRGITTAAAPFELAAG